MPPPTLAPQQRNGQADRLADDVERAALAALGSPENAAASIVRRWAQSVADAVRADLAPAVADALTLSQHADDAQR